MTVESTCTRCKFTGIVALYFGVLKQRGKEYKQSRCVDCRSRGVNYHLRPRVYQKHV
jgi:hypothetical protein